MAPGASRHENANPPQMPRHPGKLQARAGAGAGAGGTIRPPGGKLPSGKRAGTCWIIARRATVGGRSARSPTPRLLPAAGRPAGPEISVHRLLGQSGFGQRDRWSGSGRAVRVPQRRRPGAAAGCDYFDIDIAEVRAAQGSLYLLVAIDRIAKFTFVELNEKVTRWSAAYFPRHLIAAVSYKIHTVLTDKAATSPRRAIPAQRHLTSRPPSMPGRPFGHTRSNTLAPAAISTTA